MRAARLLAFVGAFSALAACGDVGVSLGHGGAGGGPAPEGLGAYGDVPNATPFNPRDLAWSTAPGGGSIAGLLDYRPGGVAYTCNGGDVILTPESPWSRRRMVILYGAAIGAAIPVSVVRARTAGAPIGDYARYVRKTTCDLQNRFYFSGLPSGAWYVITVAKPVDGRGEAMAVTRRVEVRGGQRSITLN
jgi:hypothetical protein